MAMMPADDGPVWGCVLIGGRSRRMGRPKHLIEAGGCSWLERTVTLLGYCVERVVIAGPGDVPATLAGTEHLADAAGAQSRPSQSWRPSPKRRAGD